jgi:DNA-binding MarR family transcriptional regulator
MQTSTDTRSLAQAIVEILPVLARHVYGPVHGPQFQRQAGKRRLPQPTALQVQIAGLLWLHGPLTISELAARLGVTPPATTALVDKLEKMYWVERVRDPADRRVVWVRLTPEVGAVVENAVQHRIARLVQFLEEMPEEERAPFVRNLKRLSEVLGEGVHIDMDALLPFLRKVCPELVSGVLEPAQTDAGMPSGEAGGSGSLPKPV